MKINKPKNINYCATVVEIKQLVSLDNCDNVVHAIIMGNKVVVGKDTKEGDIGLFFPVETALSKEYLSANNLYRKKELNLNPEKAGYFEENGRIRCVKFRGNSSEGLFMPLDSLEFALNCESDGLIIGDEFDELEKFDICHKYIPKNAKMPGSGNSKKPKQPKETKIIDDQFRFHQDTSQLYKNLHQIKPDDIISITYKEHGTSGISSKVLCKRNLSLFEKLLRKFGVNISDKQYDYVYSSRKVIKNAELNPNANHFYGVDIWGLAHDKVKDFLQDGMTLYYETVGHLPSGAEIQKDYNYGCKEGEFDIKIYRITYTNQSGKVFEFSAKQVQDWCKDNGLKPVEELYYGEAREFYDGNISEGRISLIKIDEWRATFLEYIKDKYNNKDCHLCSKKVPEEGVVIRIEGSELKAFKCKSERFYQYETKMLDKGIVDIETEQDE